MHPSTRPLAVAVLIHPDSDDARRRAATRAHVTAHAHCEGYALLYTYDLDAGSPFTARALRVITELAAISGATAVLVHGLAGSAVRALAQRDDLRVLLVPDARRRHRPTATPNR